MAESDYSSATDVFFSELMNLSTGIVWKNPYAVLKYEQNVNLSKVELWLLARQGRLEFFLVEQFDRPVLEEIGITREDMINDCMMDSNNIPYALRDLALEKEQKYIIDHYVEENNYYRMLYGLPDLNEPEENFFYNTEYPDISSADVPIHELDSVQLYMLEANGYLEKLIKDNPTKKYLQHLTTKKIDPYTARQSDDFSILWMNGSDYANLLQDFVDTYNECKGLMTTVFYQKSMASETYCGFFGMMILFQTILQLHRKYLETDITRDFYDEDSIKLIYDSYGVPLYETIPMEYHRKIVQNINTLLSHKGSTKAFYDMFDIFGIPDMIVNSFNLMKIRKFDKDGIPVFSYDEEGNPIYEDMYDLVFGKVPLYNDPTIAMQISSNREPYKRIISGDPYWVDDAELRQKLYSEEFNFMESKYLGIQTTFKLMKIIYEADYYLKLLLDNRLYLAKTNVYHNSIRAYVNIFDIVIYLCAIVTKRYGYSGNIPTDLSSIGKVMGFNFLEDIMVVKQHITEDDYLKSDPDLLKYLESMSVYDAASIKKVYDNLTALRNHIQRKIIECSDKDEYWAYYELYQLMMYSQYAEATFTKKDQTIAISFEDMLKDCNSDLFSRYLYMDESEFDKEIQDTLFLLKNSCSSLKDIQFADNGSLSTLIEYLFKLLEFFKSAKADLLGYEIVFSLVTSFDNMMKFIDYIDLITETQYDQASIFDELTSDIWKTYEVMRLFTIFELTDYIHHIEDTTWLSSWLQLYYDELHKISETLRDILVNHELLDQLAAKHKQKLPDDIFESADQLFEIYSDIKALFIYTVRSEFPEFYGKVEQIIEASDVMVEPKQLVDDVLTYMLLSPLPNVFHQMEDKVNDIYEASQISSDHEMEDEIHYTHTEGIGKSEMPMHTKLNEFFDIHRYIKDLSELKDDLSTHLEVVNMRSIRESATMSDRIFLKYEETFDDE